MNDEIKEILEQLEWYRKIGKKDVYYPECVLPNKKAFILLDYIINLQQLEQDHKETNATLMSELAKLEEENERLKTIKPCMLNFQECYVVKDYKSRCEKASEYIKEHIRIDDEYPDYMEMLIEERDELLNILQNGSDSQ